MNVMVVPVSERLSCMLNGVMHVKRLAGCWLVGRACFILVIIMIICINVGIIASDLFVLITPLQDSEDRIMTASGLHPTEC